MGIMNWSKKQMSELKQDMKQRVKYNFKALNPVDFELTLNINVSSGAMQLVFEQVKERLKIAKQVDIEGLDHFDIDAKFHNLLQTSLDKHLKQVKEQVGDDYIKIQSCEIFNAYFERDRKDLFWRVFVQFKGTYVDER